MPLMSIGGLASGLDTATIISQLMQLEAIPQTRLRERVSVEQSSVTALQELNAKLAALTTQAQALAKTTAWSPVTGTSSSEHVTVKTTESATAGSLSFTVNQTAQAHKITFNTAAALTDRITPADTTMVRVTAADGTTTDVDTVDGTLGGLVTALNSADLGLSASTVQLADGSHRLHVTATSTGDASRFSIGNVDPAAPALLGGENAAYTTTGQDAVIVVGPDELRSSSNTFAGVLTGVEFTLSSATPPATAVDLTITSDTKAMTDSVKAMVDAVNTILAEIDKVTAPAINGAKGGVLAGDSTLRSLRNNLLSSVYASADGTSLAGAGIQLDRDGQIVFDAEKFAAAYTAKPTDVTAKLAGAGGFADRIAVLGGLASDSRDGSITAAIKGHTAAIDRFEDDIASWDTRLATRRSNLERQYAALEVALSNLQNQGSWLAGQLAGLPKYS